MTLHAEKVIKERKNGDGFGLLTRNDYLLAFGGIKDKQKKKRVTKVLKRMGMVVVGCAVK